jgi:subtilisin family serine protease
MSTISTRTRSVFITLVALGILTTADTARTQQAQNPPQATANELLVEFEPWVTEQSKDSLRRLVKAARASRVRSKGQGHLERIRVAAGGDVSAAIRALRQSPLVRFAEPNWIYQHQATSNDPYYTNGSLWGTYGDTSAPANQFGSQAAEAWAAGAMGDSTVYIAVIDEGVDFNHPDLAANIWTNPFDPVDGLDNDGNGYRDDVRGWDFYQNNNSVYDGGPGNTTVDAHGTHVSGTIGAAGGNSTGVAGVNWNVTIISTKFLGPNGGSTADAVEALDYIVDLKQRHGLNIVATNNSWGGGGYSQALHDAILRAAKAGILFIAAAGNNGTNNDASPRYPSNYSTLTATATETAATYEAVTVVASLTSAGARSSFSNYGKASVDLGAPGSGIWSTTPSNTYRSFSGTSMATPHVSGAAALYKSVNPAATAQQVRSAILQSATTTPTASMAGITVTGGRLNLGVWFTGPPPPTAPAAPTGLTATAVAATQVNLSWADNANDETGYTVERCTGASCTGFAPIATLAANTTSYQNTGLAASTTYRYRVFASNSAGNSGSSNVASATTQGGGTAPAAPTGLTATAASSSHINLSWIDNANNETGYIVERCTGASCTNFAQIASLAANSTSYQNTGLAASTTYRYRVFAASTSGNSGYSNTASATTQAAGAAGAPAAPSNLAAVVVTGPNAKWTEITWTDNSNNETGFRLERCTGSGCTNFVLIKSVGANITRTEEYPVTAATTYRYRLRAYNTSGYSAYSNIAETTTP